MNYNLKFLVIILLLLISCNRSKYNSKIEGKWILIDSSKQSEARKLHRVYLQDSISIYTTFTDSGYVDLFYINDSLYDVSKTNKIDILNIHFYKPKWGLMKFERKDTLESASIEFFTTYEFEIFEDYIITTEGDTFTYQLAKKDLLLLNGKEYKRLETFPNTVQPQAGQK